MDNAPRIPEEMSIDEVLRILIADSDLSEVEVVLSMIKKEGLGHARPEDTADETVDLPSRSRSRQGWDKGDALLREALAAISLGEACRLCHQAYFAYQLAERARLEEGARGRQAVKDA